MSGYSILTAVPINNRHWDVRYVFSYCLSVRGEPLLFSTEAESGSFSVTIEERVLCVPFVKCGGTFKSCLKPSLSTVLSSLCLHIPYVTRFV
jgi:hypothetical protein